MGDFRRLFADLTVHRAWVDEVGLLVASSVSVGIVDGVRRESRCETVQKGPLASDSPIGCLACHG